jgi:uncharacterized protein YecE (DUF72 family)
MSKKSSCLIGTSGWHYEHWKGPFYPEDMPEKGFLSFYSERFDVAEINNSFYQLPDKGTFQQWRQTVGKGFVFAVKASRYITHMKKLKDLEKSLSNFMDSVDSLDGRLGPILFQLPPRWHMNPERLESFLDKLPDRRRYTFEFRDKSWFDERVYDLLSAHNAAFCIYDLEGQMSPEIVTADFIYIRLHGPDKNAYEGSYSKRKLNSFAKKFNKWTREGKDVFCFFDNDQKGFAAENALTLQQIVNS